MFKRPSLFLLVSAVMCSYFSAHSLGYITTQMKMEEFLFFILLLRLEADSVTLWSLDWTWQSEQDSFILGDVLLSLYMTYFWLYYGNCFALSSISQCSFWWLHLPISLLVRDQSKKDCSFQVWVTMLVLGYIGTTLVL